MGLVLQDILPKTRKKKITGHWNGGLKKVMNCNRLNLKTTRMPSVFSISGPLTGFNSQHAASSPIFKGLMSTISVTVPTRLPQPIP